MLLDLRSDTVTKPTAAMRRAMAEAEVGDDVLDGDPTVLALEAEVALRLGKERALFFPTGTMANQAAIYVHAERGTEIYLHDDSHILNWEMAGVAALGGVQPRLVSGAPVMTVAGLRKAIRPSSKHAPRVSLLCLENTHNGAGGMVTPLADLQALAAVARESAIPVHLDGARLWNASAATGTHLADFAACATTVMVSFSKGLGAPVGAALAGDSVSIAKAHEARKRFGGGMRQSGILAAGCLYGLREHLGRLRDDHANAKRFATIVGAAEGARVVPPDTNIVMTDVAEGRAAAIVDRARERGVLISQWNASRVRAVMHLDVDAEQVERAAKVVAEVIANP
ncbi:MAG: aminotransferase class I/II-fold pyridoxal phosphate-dependent enzyme [Gemmatimonadaceae bacterium]|nr:aminotransferase class I/II-fold pyridoxal phosphate-dependent enzyme [Gemmatimonadaceae bacterium]